ncbi:hypothetical protein K7X08_009011 [Anisodus acutangulus]|uniref:peptidylprolyl isomerase n=1 Tax=Anisodus acutangulus TaxID=402998 RepID=A0A9Q1N2E4_9SOLA|nr:hypothetical protein K7X08_009011 [Anisodus acutangulus]
MGVEKEVIRAGSGSKPQPGQTVTVHCTGYGKNRDLSQKFWSTKDPGQQPFSFQIGQGKVIKGWDEGVLGMQFGEVARLTCTPDYAYGAGGFPAWGIQPNSVLVFEIEVLSAQTRISSQNLTEPNGIAFCILLCCSIITCLGSLSLYTKFLLTAYHNCGNFFGVKN